MSKKPLMTVGCQETDDSDNEIQSQYMKDNVVYNKHDNEVMIKTNGDYIYIICKEEDHVQPVMDRMNTDTCFLSDYEEWDEGEDMKWILTFKVFDEPQDMSTLVNAS